MQTYQDKVLDRRTQEAKVMWLNMQNDGFTESSVAAFDFTFITQNQDDAQKLIDKLSDEKYTAEIEPEKQQGYHIIQGTSRPYAYDFNPEEFISWAQQMTTIGFNSNAIFANWTVTDSETNKTWTSEDINTD